MVHKAQTSIFTIKVQNKSILIPYIEFLNQIPIKKPTEDKILDFLHRNKKNSDIVKEVAKILGHKGFLSDKEYETIKNNVE